ncbi:hypothetical protein K450DRAFT_271321 [Umbelopsis ramanniana AG]|uniref:Uncharacterized protein n=1 Tax=Umbelopsis ramanniana AG TaxID=1314678 RepID=A0AAD5HF20_UMBRA|nr:uncharacterized protein K450DRAFT_271321 [Umbelopsis ramanniana AG]KAI8580216.1 hypothetical protein K450DRAFT_271321 [Umbelopsis ramanniana AG]
MLETLWTLTGLVISTPGQKELPKSIVTKALNDKILRLPVIKEEYTTDNTSNIKTEKISVQLVEEDDSQDSVFLDIEEEHSQIHAEEKDLPALPLSPAEEEESPASSDDLVDIETLPHGEDHTEEEKINASQWDSVIQPCPPTALATCSPDEVQTITSDKIRTATLPHVCNPRPSLIRDSVVVPRTKDIDRYKILYKIKYDNRKSRDSWLTMDGRMSIRNSRSGMPRVKQMWHEFREGKSSSGQLPLVYARQRRSQAKGHYFFWGGFVCPIIWVIGAWYLEKTASSADDKWRRRCSRAAMLTTVLSVCCLLVFFVVHPSIFVPRMSFKPPTGTTVFGSD